MLQPIFVKRGIPHLTVDHCPAPAADEDGRLHLTARILSSSSRHTGIGIVSKVSTFACAAVLRGCQSSAGATPDLTPRSMAASEAYMDKVQLRQSYRNVWHTDLTNAIQADFPYCCLSLWCGPCMSYMLRRRALYNDMSRYVCCAGYMPCSGRCGESNCPEICLATEVFLCFGSSVASTRFLLQDEFNIQTTECDNCIISFMFCLQQLACICSLVACIVGNQELSEASRIISCISDMVYWTVCSCMQTQHKVEMDKRDGKFGPQYPMAVPPMQQMSRIDQPVPPQAGYPYPPPQPAYYYR